MFSSCHSDAGVPGCCGAYATLQTGEVSLLTVAFNHELFAQQRLLQL